MSLSVIKYPYSNVNGHTSKWSCVHQPIEWKLQRKDASVQIKQLVAGKVRLTIIGGVPSIVQVGQKIYFSSSSQKYLLTIVSISGNYITTDGTISGNVYGGFVNYVDAYKNYYIETKIIGVNSANTYGDIGVTTNKPDSTGIARVCIQQWLRTRCTFQNDFLYNKINQKQAGEGAGYNLQFREVYNGSVGKYTTLNSSISYWTNSAKQIQNIFGINMADFVPTRDDTRTNRAKFQSVFKRPTLFPGYPFSLNFIYSDNMLNYNVKRIERTLDINGNQIVQTTDLLNATQRGFANRLMLKEGYASNVKTLEVWLESNELITLNPTEWTGGYTIGNTFKGFTEKQPIKTPEK